MTGRDWPFRALNSEPKLLASIASTTVAFALSKGMTMIQIQQATGVSGLELMDPDARLPDDVVAKLWRALSTVPSEIPLSIEMARAAPFTILGGLAHGSQFAADLRSALGLVVENQALLADRLECNLHEEGTNAYFSVAHPSDVIDLGATTELGLAIMRRLLTEVLGVSGSLRRVEFANGPKGTIEAYEDYFDVPVVFHAPLNQLVLRQDHLDKPISQANVNLFGFVKKHFELVIRRLDRNTYPPELRRLRDAVLENASRGQFGVAAAAAGAHLSLRSAQRLTAAHGTSIQELIDEIRAATAKQLLGDASVDVEAVAMVVGYSDARAFRRAFKRWTGSTPSKFRNDLDA